MSNMVSKLTEQEQLSLSRAEAVVSEGLKSFIAVGKALAKIQNHRLYRSSHATFSDYLKDRWGITRAHGYRMIKSAQFVKELESLAAERPITLPMNERQVRLLQSINDRNLCLSILERAQKLAGGEAPKTRQLQEAIQELHAHEQTPNPRRLTDNSETKGNCSHEITRIFTNLIHCLESRTNSERELYLLKRLQSLVTRLPDSKKHTLTDHESHAEIRIDGANAEYVIRV